MIIRHGFSTWNEKNLFTGWQDVQLTDSGIDEAKRAAQVIKQNGFTPDVVYTSVLDRAIKTNDLLLEGLNLNNVEVHQTWLLNERHYGALTGLNKVETVVQLNVANPTKDHTESLDYLKIDKYQFDDFQTNIIIVNRVIDNVATNPCLIFASSTYTWEKFLNKLVRKN